MAISNRYKNTLEDFIDGLDAKFPDRRRQIDKGLRNLRKSENNSMGFLKENYLNNNI